MLVRKGQRRPEARTLVRRKQRRQEARKVRRKQRTQGARGLNAIVQTALTAISRWTIRVSALVDGWSNLGLRMVCVLNVVNIGSLSMECAVVVVMRNDEGVGL